MIIGRGDYLAQAKGIVAAMKLEDRVSFLPAVLIEELPTLLRQADVGLVPNWPSAATHLMLPVKMLEYATLGIPILAARLRTVERYFEDAAIQFFEAGNPAALAAAIQELQRDPERRAQLACRASEIAETLSWKHQSDRFFDAIDSLIYPKASALLSHATRSEDQVTDPAIHWAVGLAVTLNRFILVHPEEGIVIIKVKGGHISQTAIWANGSARSCWTRNASIRSVTPLIKKDETNAPCGKNSLRCQFGGSLTICHESAHDAT